MITDDPNHPDIDVPGPDGQNKAYLVLSDAERAKGFVRPFRNTYRHVGKRPKGPTRALTEDELARYNNAGFVCFEPNLDPTSPIKGRFWTQAELDSGCGTITSMGTALSETYAAQPKFYGSTWCCACGGHFKVSEFVWDADGQEVGS